MKNLLFLVFFLLSTSLLYSENYLALLNKAIDNKSYYDGIKEQKIDELKQFFKMQDLTYIQKYDVNYNLFQEYKKYKTDSAIYYVKNNLAIAKALNNKDLINETNLHLSSLYSVTGLYIESIDILNKIDQKHLSEKLLPLYFETYSHFYEYYAQSNNSKTYHLLNEAYQDSLLMILDPMSVNYKIIYTKKMVNRGQVGIAEKSLLKLLKEVPEKTMDYAMVTYLLGNVYSSKHDSRQAKKYYALSAITDINNSNKDNASLLCLALTYYRDGDIGNTHKFTKSAIEDAVFSNVRFRTIEISEFYSIINSVYLAQESKQKSELQIYLVSISILSLFLIIAVIYVYKQMKQVSRIRKELYHANIQQTKLNEDIISSNKQLKEVNTLLSESNQIKEEYIANFFDICSTYINKWEVYRKSLNKKAANNQLDDLFKMLKSTDIVDDELEELYSKFDNIFLSLYPTFVEDFNSLIVTEEQIFPKPGELLNTELRIFALIRLGITDSVKIAGFLRYSLSTIYNYRTKARNKAVISRNEFENQVMKIGIIQKHN